MIWKFTSVKLKWNLIFRNVRDNENGFIRIRARLSEERILPTEHYQPLISLLMESVSPEKVSFKLFAIYICRAQYMSHFHALPLYIQVMVDSDIFLLYDFHTRLTFIIYLYHSNQHSIFLSPGPIHHFHVLLMNEPLNAFTALILRLDRSTSSLIYPSNLH